MPQLTQTTQVIAGTKQQNHNVLVFTQAEQMEAFRPLTKAMEQ